MGECRELQKMKNSGNEAKKYLKTKHITFLSAANYARLARNLAQIRALIYLTDRRANYPLPPSRPTIHQSFNFYGSMYFMQTLGEIYQETASNMTLRVVQYMIPIRKTTITAHIFASRKIP